MPLSGKLLNSSLTKAGAFHCKELLSQDTRLKLKSTPFKIAAAVQQQQPKRSDHYKICFYIVICKIA